MVDLSDTAVADRHPTGRCSDCIFFDRPPNGITPPQGATERDRLSYLTAGRCRRAAPAPDPSQSGFQHWSLTMEHSSCGAYREETLDAEPLPPCSECRSFYQPPMGITPPSTAPEHVRLRYEGAGFCHRRAPDIASNGDEFPRWPMVHETDWCGSARRGPRLRISLPRKPAA